MPPFGNNEPSIANKHPIQFQMIEFPSSLMKASSPPSHKVCVYYNEGLCHVELWLAFSTQIP